MSTTRDTAPETLAPPGQPRTKWTVLAVSGAITAAVALWALIAPTQSSEVLGVVVGWTSEWFGWFYIVLATVILVFVLYLGVRHSRVRLGQDDDRPEFSTFAWASMLFAAGIGTDVMFYAVAEPASQYLYPPQGEGGTLEAAREATVWTLFHYGITGWGMYALMGIALGYYAHRMGLPLAVRSTLYPLIGKRVKGPLGDAVDIATVIGTIFGVATSLGIGVVMLNVGLDVLFGVSQGIPAQIGLVVLAILVATISATTGVDKGIRLLSQLNVLLAIGLAGWVLVTGETAFLLRGMMMNVGDFVSMFPGMTLDTMAFDYPAEWMGFWTLFFWAWWIAWASFVGMFLARISKGRTIGQFVLGTMTIPFSYIVMWVSIFGNSAVKQIRDGDEAFGEAAVNTPELGFFTLLQQYPLGLAVVALATFVGLLFYVTSADSGALVMANLSSELPSGEADARPWLRIVWSVATGVLTIAMLLVGGIPALQSATIIMGLPFAFVIVAVMVGLHRALEHERTRTWAFQDSVTTSLVGREASGVPWRLRLAQSFGSVTVDQAQERLDDVVVPALHAVRDALEEQGVPARVEVSEADPEARVVRSATLLVAAEGDEVGFTYPVQVRRGPAPTYGLGRLAHDRTTRLQVAQPIAGGYDLMSYDVEDVCHDVLDQYERWAASSARVAEQREL
ncbi:choline BCCT transporter BetT [Serinicoccus kebangsaanensis]|uniref:choline BCCT transporter BetT n=1 Tax=Serinicoccus kebangsaanensis TaxID=2602069 RepID=UPI00124EA1DB|nr:choline BCCT transporter BetT [Serinicoccus kebangsaanensis]